MKRIEFILCLLFISTVIFAQKEIAPTKNLDAYTGTWVYQSNDTIFKIVLKKGHVESEYMITNGLVGGYFLSVKGKVVENYPRQCIFRQPDKIHRQASACQPQEA